jgi:hypothetical protein
MPLPALKDYRKRRKEPRETPSIQSLDRGLLILEAVGRSTEPVSLGYLSTMLGIDRSSAFRLANTLKRRGFLSGSLWNARHERNSSDNFTPATVSGLAQNRRRRCRGRQTDRLCRGVEGAIIETNAGAALDGAEVPDLGGLVVASE